MNFLEFLIPAPSQYDLNLFKIIFTPYFTPLPQKNYHWIFDYF